MIKKINEKNSAKKIVDFMIEAGKLKWTKRSGWLEKHLIDPETVAEHTYRVTILSKILSSFLNLDPNKLTAMAIFHDLSEGALGDPITERGGRIVGAHNIKEESKYIKKLFNNLSLPFLYKYWYENILENTTKKTVYSDILYQIGKIATCWQALEYEILGISQESLEEFWINARLRVKVPLLINILNILNSLRKKLYKKIKMPFRKIYRNLTIEEKIINFMLITGSLKWQKRNGWLKINVFEPESIMEHAFRVTILTRILTVILKLDEEKLTGMAIFHDFIEGLFGDPLVEGNFSENHFVFENNSLRKNVTISKKDLIKQKKFIKKFSQELNLGDSFYLLEEQLKENSQEANFFSNFIFQVGKLSNVWQALEYELRGVPRQFTERFWVSANFYIKHPLLRKILLELEKISKQKSLIV